MFQKLFKKYFQQQVVLKYKEKAQPQREQGKVYLVKKDNLKSL